MSRAGLNALNSMRHESTFVSLSRSLPVSDQIQLEIW